MRWPMYLIGLTMLILGSKIVIDPEFVRKMIDYIDGVRLRIYTVGVLRFAIGILLVFSSANARLYGFVSGLGILILLGGVAYFAIPLNTLTKIIKWYRERSDTNYRMMGIAVIVLSSILLFAC